MNPKCDLCGRKLTFEFEATCAWSYGLDETSVGGHWVCPATPDQHRIAELEKQVAELEAEIEARGPVAVTKRVTPEGERIAELELEEAKTTNRNNPSCMMPDDVYPCDAFQVALRLGAEKLKLVSERDAAEAQLRAREAEVLALREVLEDVRGVLNDACQAVAIYGDQPPQLYLDAIDKAQAALSSSSATSQESVARIEREAVEKAWARLLEAVEYTRIAAGRWEPGIVSKEVWIDGGEPMICARESRFRAAILGEKEKG